VGERALLTLGELQLRPPARAGGGRACSSLPGVSQAAALFDWDGTLLDSRAALLRAWHEATVDVLAGLRAGTMVIGVSWGHFGERELRAAGAAAVAGHPEELVELVMNTMREGVGT